MVRVPRRLPNVATTSLSAEDKHLLDSVDGNLGEEELAFVTGMLPNEVAAALARLVERGLVSFEPDGDAADRAVHAPSPPVAGGGIDLSREQRETIDKLLDLVNSADYYRMLGVHRDATKDEIKVAYYKIGPRFHPDRYFRKHLGPYKQKIETIFGKLTKAHDTLRYGRRREGYDAALPPLKPGDRIPRVPAQTPSRPGSSSRPSRPSGAAGATSSAPPDARASQPDIGRGSSPTPAPSPAPAVSDLGPAPSQPPRASVPGPAPSRPSVSRVRRAQPRVRRRDLSPEERKAQRQILAKKLSASIRPPSASRPPPAPVSAPRVVQRPSGSFKSAEEVGQSAAEVIRQRFDLAADGVRQRRVDRYLETARVAMMTSDYRAAEAALEQALRIRPDDEEIRNKHEEAVRRAKSS